MAAIKRKRVISSSGAANHLQKSKKKLKYTSVCGRRGESAPNVCLAFSSGQWRH